MLFSLGCPRGVRGLDLGPQTGAFLHSWHKAESVTRFGLWPSFLSYERMWLHGKCPEFESWLYLPPALCDLRGSDLSFVPGPPIINGR